MAIVGKQYVLEFVYLEVIGKKRPTWMDRGVKLLVLLLIVVSMSGCGTEEQRHRQPVPILKLSGSAQNLVANNISPQVRSRPK